MVYTNQYSSPLGLMTIACDDNAILGLWFNGQKHFANIPPKTVQNAHIPLIQQAKHWLDIYFTGHNPDFLPPLRYGLTPFRKRVCDILLTIPYGQTMTYGEIAEQIANERGLAKMSAQAVGNAIGHNPISLMIPCHRVLGANGKLTGYAGGLGRKAKLLALEGVYQL